MAEDKKKNISRRRFIKNSSYAAGGVIGGGLLGSVLGVNLGGNSNQSGSPTSGGDDGGGVGGGQNFNRALMFFNTQADFEILSAATERIFPEDEDGPGAIELGAPYFIDHQLAGDYGVNSREYMQGPFQAGSPFQGYQSSLSRRDLFQIGVRRLEEEAQSNFDSAFVDLSGEQQDQILEMFENDEVNFKGTQPSFFFEELRLATLSGAFADPMYGGNNNMDGWRMRNFPGSRPSYLNQIEDEGFIEMEPQALNDHSV